MRSRRLPLVWLIFGLLLAPLAISGAAPTAATASPAPQSAVLTEAITRARSVIEKTIAPKVPGVSVAVGVDGQIVWSEGFGYADVAHQTPVTPATRFRIGSISKSITAAGLALLVEHGQLDLDAPIQAYVPEFPVKEARITTRMLAGHLAGIRHYRGREMYSNKPYATLHDSLKIFIDDPLEAKPGTKYLYSTYGWTVISAAMQTASKQEFLAYMDATVIQPLHLDHTRPDRAGAIDAERTQFYESDSAGRFVVAPPVDNSYKWAAGGYLSTPEDLVRFGSAHLQPGFFKPETLALLFTSQKTTDGKPTGYGVGWSVHQDSAGHRVMMHTGGSIGGTSVLLIHPASKTVVAMVCNHTKSPFTKESYEAIAELFSPLFTASPSAK